MGGIAEPRRPEVLPLRPDNPELPAVGLDGERELIRRAGGADRKLAAQLSRAQGGDRQVLRARPGHESVAAAVGYERHAVGSRQRLRIRACSKIHRRRGRATCVIELLVHVARLAGRVRPERKLSKARGIDRQRLAVAATEVEVVVQRAAVVTLVDVDEAGAVLREHRRSVAA